MIAGDIVSTFGRSPDRGLRFYDLRPEESLCLRLLARGPSAYFAPVGPNHGYLASAEMHRAITERLPVGEAIRRNHIDIALTYRASGGIPLVQQKAGAHEDIPDVPGGIMREGTLNRILFGDPTFEPFAKLGPAKPSLTIYWMDVSGGIGSRRSNSSAVVTVADPKSPEHWDPYRGSPSRDKVPDRGERVVGSFEIPLGTDGIEDITVRSEGLPPGIELTNAEWAVENRRARSPVVWFSLNAPKHADFSKRNLWIAGARFTLAIKHAEDSTTARNHGEMKR
jgi:hypothetical protein